MVRTNHHRSADGRTRDTRLLVAPAIALVVTAVVAALTGLATPARAATATQVDLGTARHFAVLANSEITNSGSTYVRGDIGIYDGTAVTGYEEIDHDGDLHATDGVAQQAQDDLTTAYNSAASQDADSIDRMLGGGQTLFSGVYEAPDFQITGQLTLDAQGTAGKVWIFQMGSTLNTAAGSSVRLVNGAHPCNVFWQVGSSATLGTDSTLAGNILASESISLGTGAIIRGRALASNGAVTMLDNDIRAANCPSQVAPDPEPEPAPSPSPSPSPSPAPSPAPSPSASPSPSPTPSPAVSPAPTASASPSEVAAPVDSTTDGPTTGTPDAPDAPDAAAPPGGGTPQVPVVPTGPVPAGDGSMASDGDRSPGILLLPIGAALVLGVTWRRRNA